jgi:hypothetical protein
MNALLAAIITVRVLVVPGPLSLDSELTTALEWCGQQLPVQVRWEIVPAEYHGPAVDLASRLEAWRYWAARFGGRQLRRHDIPRVVVMPPLWDSGKSWMAGYGLPASYARPPRVPLAIVWAGAINSSGANRVPHSSVVICHELGHVLGAIHTEDCSIMHASAMGCPMASMKFSAESAQRIVRYVRQNRRK